MSQGVEELQETLQEVKETAGRTRRAVRYKGPDALYVIWGVVWMVGFTAQHQLPATPLRFGHFAWPLNCVGWTPLVVAGAAASAFIFRRRTPVDPSAARPMGMFWLLLFAYVGLWLTLLAPMFDPRKMGSAELTRVVTAIYCLVPMFAYVVMGPFGCGRYMIWLGLGVSCMTLVGFFAVPNYFYLWMAVVGGGR